MLVLSVIAGSGCGRRVGEATAEQRLDQLAGLRVDMSLDSLGRAVPWLACRRTAAGARFDHTCSWEAGGYSALVATLDMRLAQIGVVWIGSGQQRALPSAARRAKTRPRAPFRGRCSAQ